jgi:hypothetical protein
MLIPNPFNKKYLCEKYINKKVQEKWSFKPLTYYFGQRFSAYNFFWGNFFVYYFQWIRNQHKILRFMITIWKLCKCFLLVLTLFAKFEAERAQNG